MSFESLTITFLDGVSIAMVLFLAAVGLTLIFGLMDVINLSHGVLFALGAYMAYSVLGWTGNFALAVAASTALLAAVGLVFEPLFLRPLYARGSHLDQVLMTLGLTLVLGDVLLWVWGAQVLSPNVPGVLGGTVDLFDQQYSIYRLFVIGFGFAVAAILVLVERRTLYGAVIRAGTRDPEMVAAVGINIRRVFWLAFVVGAALAGMGGAIGAPILGLSPGMDAPILITSLVIVVVGGMGSLSGSFWGSILIGLAQSFGALWIPTFSLFLVYVLMVIVLLLRPQGLFGGESIRR